MFGRRLPGRRLLSLFSDKPGIQLDDHIVVSKCGNASFKTLGVL